MIRADQSYSNCSLYSIHLVPMFDSILAQACLAWCVPTLNLLIIVCIVCIYKIILGASQKYFVNQFASATITMIIITLIIIIINNSKFSRISHVNRRSHCQFTLSVFIVGHH